MSYTITLKKKDGEVIEIAVPSTSTTTTTNTTNNVVDKPWKNAKIVHTQNPQLNNYLFVLLDFDGDGIITQNDVNILKKMNLSLEQMNELYKDFPAIEMPTFNGKQRFEGLVDLTQTAADIISIPPSD
jgi:hypothetical protein